MKRKIEDQSSDRLSKTRDVKEEKVSITKYFIRPDPVWSDRVETLDDLLNIAWNYKGTQGEAPFDWVTLWLLIPVLTELRNMTGMEELKRNVVSLILYHIQNLHQSPLDDQLHTMISGPPGCGKSQVVKILAKIYRGLNLLPSENVLLVKRDELVGFNAERNVKDRMEKAKGGIMFVDETASIGSIEKGVDDFISAVDVLNQYLERGNNVVCVMASSEAEMEKYLFFVNSGIKTSFSRHFQIPRYTAPEMMTIFRLRTQREGWSLKDGALSEKLFVKHAELFPAYGRDISNLFLMCKIAHGERLFSPSASPKKTLTTDDILTGLGKYKDLKKKERRSTLTYFG